MLQHFAEVMEQVRLNKIYEGLRVSDDRPKYINNGKDQDYYLRQPHRKTRALFPPLSSGRKNGIAIPGLKTRFRPIMGGSPANYFMRYDGTAASVGAATGPGTSVGDCMDLDINNADALNEIDPGDVIKICDDGGIYRASLIPKWGNNGTALNPITYEPEEGDSPQFWGSTTGATWTEPVPGSDQWRCDFGIFGPDEVWFSKAGIVHWGNVVANVGALVAEYDWFWDGAQFLWCFSPDGDPDTVYNYVEGSTVDFGINAQGNRDYYVIDGIEFRFWQDGGIYAIAGGDGWTIQNCDLAYMAGAKNVSGDGIIINKSNSTIQNNIVHDCSVHGIYLRCMGGGITVENVIVQNNEVYDCWHTLIDTMNINGTILQDSIVRYNKCYFTADWDPSTFGCVAIYVQGNVGFIVDDIDVYYNLCYNNGGHGILINKYTENIRVYNNAVYGTHPDLPAAPAQYSYGISLDGAGIDAVIFKNNIAMDVRDRCFGVTLAADVAACDHNCWYQSAGGAAVYTRVAAANYHFDDQAAYQAATGWDTNGLWEDPLFMDAVNYDLRLQSLSPCIDAGEDVGLNRDYIGTLVPRGPAPDIGAYEALFGAFGGSRYGDIRWPFRKRYDSGKRL